MIYTENFKKENKSSDPRIQSPEDLSKWMAANIEYGFLGSDHKVHLDFDNMNLYRLQSPEQVYSNKVGVCWDQVFFEKYILDKLKIKSKIYFINTDSSDYTTHTFLIYYKNNKIYYFENSYERYRGIHEFKSEKEAVNYVLSNMKNDYEFNDYGIYEITKDPKYGCKGSEFYNFCVSQKVYKEDNGMIFTNRNSDIYHEGKMGKYKNNYEDGFYGVNVKDPDDPIGIWNSIVWKGNKAYRERSEMLVLNDKDEVYIGPPNKRHKDYTLPGGSTEPGFGPKETAIKETQEEALMEVKDVRFLCVYEDDTYHKELIMMDNNEKFIYDGMRTHVYVGRFDKKYTGEVEVGDRDENMAKKGKWVKIDKLNKTHKEAVEKYLKNPKKELLLEDMARQIGLIESAKVKHKNSKKRVTCPYCDFRDYKLQVIDHIEEKHEDMIPEGYTPARLVFNKLNHKEVGYCVECKVKETKWNEETWRYDRYCSKQCETKAAKRAKENMKKVYGKEHLLDDPEYQANKMLKNRKISGTYTWSDGTKKSYCGSYEKNLLEFLDKVIHCKSEDYDTPGPIIEYEFEGKKLHWITDGYYYPANLAFDVKDGGDNPNNRDMPVYRAKQEAKEKAIKEQGKYNYIRLTNNDFTQLLVALAYIREELMDGNSDTMSFINEYMSGIAVGAGAMIGTADAESYIVNSMMDNTFVNSYYSKDRFGFDMYEIKDKKLKKTTLENIKQETGMNNFLFFKYNGDKSDLVEAAYENQTNCNWNFLYETLSGDKMLSFNDIYYNSQFELVLDGGSIVKEQNSIIEESIQFMHDLEFGTANYLELFTEDEIKEKVRLLEGREHLNICNDIKGYFVLNENSKCRSKSYKSMQEIPSIVIDLLDK